MEIITNIIETTLNSFDFSFCIIVNVMTYLIINLINSRNGNKNLTTWKKRLVLIGVIIFISAFYLYDSTDKKIVLNSAILSPVFWSWVMKPICKKFKLDYKQLSLFE